MWKGYILWKPNIFIIYVFQGIRQEFECFHYSDIITTFKLKGWRKYMLKKIISVVIATFMLAYNFFAEENSWAILWKLVGSCKMKKFSLFRIVSTVAYILLNLYVIYRLKLSEDGIMYLFILAVIFVLSFIKSKKTI